MFSIYFKAEIVPCVMMGVSESIAECRYFLDSLNQGTEHNLILPRADTTAPGTPGEKVFPLVGRARRPLSKQGSAMWFAEGHTDHTDDLGINGDYGRSRLRRVRKPPMNIQMAL